MGKYVENGHKDAVNHLNNFFCYFKCSKLLGFQDGYYRTSLKPFTGKTFLEIAKITRDSEEAVALYCFSRSDKKLAQTMDELCFEIETTATEVGCSLETIADMIFEYRNNLDKNNIDLARKAHKKLDAYIHPIYLALRQKGYNPHDLQG